MGMGMSIVIGMVCKGGDIGTSGLWGGGIASYSNSSRPLSRYGYGYEYGL